MPVDGEIMERAVPATTQRARYCGPCGSWKWEVGGYGSGKFRHGPIRSGGRRQRPCQIKERA